LVASSRGRSRHVPFHLQSEARPGRHERVTRTCDCHDKKAPRRAAFSGPTAPRMVDTLTHTGNRGVNDPWRGAGRVHRAEPGSFTPRFHSHLHRNRSRGGIERHPTDQAARPVSHCGVEALLELYTLGPSPALVVHVCGAGDRWGLRTCRASVPPCGPFLNPVRSRTETHQGGVNRWSAPLLPSSRQRPYRAQEWRAWKACSRRPDRVSDEKVHAVFRGQSTLLNT
jgi:hypothetical protein